MQMDTNSMSDPFDWQMDCFFCCGKLDEKHKDRNLFHPFTTQELRLKILEDCQNRSNMCIEDNVATSVQWRVINCLDLVSMKAKYHQQCRVEFSHPRNFISNSSSSTADS